MKRYAYMIFFWPFYHTWNLLNSHQNDDFRSATHPQSAPGIAPLTSEFHLHELQVHLL
jgi:heme O synthase-like polyprenyltransferase